MEYQKMLGDCFKYVQWKGRIWQEEERAHIICKRRGLFGEACEQVAVVVGSLSGGSQRVGIPVVCSCCSLQTSPNIKDMSYTT